MNFFIDNSKNFAKTAKKMVLLKLIFTIQRNKFNHEIYKMLYNLNEYLKVSFCDLICELAWIKLVSSDFVLSYLIYLKTNGRKDLII